VDALDAIAREAGVEPLVADTLPVFTESPA
jgi:hypothetical protein